MDTLAHNIRHATSAIELILLHDVSRDDVRMKIRKQVAIIEQALISYEMRIREKPSELAHKRPDSSES